MLNDFDVFEVLWVQILLHLQNPKNSNLLKVKQCALQSCASAGLSATCFAGWSASKLFTSRVALKVLRIETNRYSWFIGLGPSKALSAGVSSWKVNVRTEPRIQGLAQQHKTCPISINFQGQAVHGRSSAERTYRNKTDAAARSPTKTAQTCIDKIWRDATRCDKIWQDTTRRDKTRQDLTGCDTMLQALTRRDKIWQDVTRCDKMRPDATRHDWQDKMWQNVTRCDKTRQDMTRYDQIWQDATRRDKMWQDATRCMPTVAKYVKRKNYCYSTQCVANCWASLRSHAVLTCCCWNPSQTNWYSTEGFSDMIHKCSYGSGHWPCGVKIAVWPLNNQT